MKYKYERIYQEFVGDKEIQIRKNRREYILMYCKTTVKNFSKKAKLIKKSNIEAIIKCCKDLFDLEITKEQLLYSTNFKNNL